MEYKLGFLLKLLVIYYIFDAASSKVEFTNINCTSWDTDFSNFEYCYLKSVNRSYKYLSLKVNLYKKLNGYKPFLYNVTVDGCKFLKKQKIKPSLRIYIIYIACGSFSNINHTCPYNHDLVVEKLSTQFVNNQVTAVLSVPEGDYALHTSWFANNILRATANIFFTLS